MVNNTFDEREEESEGTELVLLDDILTSTAKVQTDVILLLALGFISHFNTIKPNKPQTNNTKKPQTKKHQPKPTKTSKPTH